MSKWLKRHFRKLISHLTWLFFALVILLTGVAVYLDLYLYLRPMPHELDAAIREQYVQPRRRRPGSFYTGCHIARKAWGIIVFANAGGEEGLRSALRFRELAKNLKPRLIEYIGHYPAEK